MASAGRPKKVNNDVNLEELIKKITAEVTAKVENKYEQKIKELEGVKKQSKKVKLIPDDIKVRIQSNIAGKFTFIENRGRINVYIQLLNYGDSLVISYDELRALYTSKPNFINRGQIIITDVYSNDDIELEDVLRDLRVDNIYMNESLLNPSRIKDLFTEEIDIKEFEKLLSNTPSMTETALDVAYIYFKKGQFNDNAKMNYFRQNFNNPNLFK
jgi:hypothetical protein